MGFLFAISLGLLAMAPPYMVYQRSGLPDSSGKGPVVSGIMAYACTQFVKGVLLASILPEEGLTASFIWKYELIKSAGSALDAAGLIGASAWLSKGSPFDRLFGAGLGWVIGESLLTRCPAFLSTLSDRAFQADLVYMAIEANINLIMWIAVSFLIYMVMVSSAGAVGGGARRLTRAGQKTGAMAVGACLLMPLFEGYLRSDFAPEPLWLLVGRLCVSLFAASTARSLFASFSR